MKTAAFENYPWWMVAVSNAVGLYLYAIGLYLTAQLGSVWAGLYAAYCLWLEWRLLSGSCRKCYYYGKRCGFGKGLLSSLLFARSDGQTLRDKKISWLAIAPDFLVTLVPLVVGIALLIRHFSWPTLLLVVVLALLGTTGTGLVRSQIACKYCKQRQLGCPAEQLFAGPERTTHA